MIKIEKFVGLRPSRSPLSGEEVGAEALLITESASHVQKGTHQEVLAITSLLLSVLAQGKKTRCLPKNKRARDYNFSEFWVSILSVLQMKHRKFFKEMN